MKLMDCPRCSGSGKVVDPRAEGAKLRQFRENRSITLREMARRLGFTPAYLSDIELGRRGGEGKWMDAYQKAIR